jgi:putative flippase GtrA
MFTTALRFGVVGAGGAAVNMLVLLVLVVVVHVPLLVASPVAVELAVVHNYLVNNCWTFGRRQVSMARFGKFSLSALSALLLNVAVVWALVAADTESSPPIRSRTRTGRRRPTPRCATNCSNRTGATSTTS